MSRTGPGTQVVIIGKLFTGEGVRGARNQEIEPTDRPTDIIALRGEIGASGTVITQSGEQTRRPIIGIGKGVTTTASNGRLGRNRLIGVTIGLGCLIGG